MNSNNTSELKLSTSRIDKNSTIDGKFLNSRLGKFNFPNILVTDKSLKMNDGGGGNFYSNKFSIERLIKHSIAD